MGALAWRRRRNQINTGNMSNIKIHIRINHETGLRDVFIEYESDADALPIEHEQRHMEIVHELVDSGVIKADEVGEINVTRLGEMNPESPFTNNNHLDEQNEQNLTS